MITPHPKVDDWPEKSIMLHSIMLHSIMLHSVYQSAVGHGRFDTTEFMTDLTFSSNGLVYVVTDHWSRYLAKQL